MYCGNCCWPGTSGLAMGKWQGLLCRLRDSNVDKHSGDVVCSSHWHAVLLGTSEWNEAYTHNLVLAGMRILYDFTYCCVTLTVLLWRFLCKPIDMCLLGALPKGYRLLCHLSKENCDCYWYMEWVWLLLIL